MSDFLKNLETFKEAIPDPRKLRSLASYFDLYFPNDPNPEIQNDLRRWADNLDSIFLYLETRIEDEN